MNITKEKYKKWNDVTYFEREHQVEMLLNVKINPFHDFSKKIYWTCFSINLYNIFFDTVTKFIFPFGHSTYIDLYKIDVCSGLSMLKGLFIFFYLFIGMFVFLYVLFWISISSFFVI